MMMNGRLALGLLWSALARSGGEKPWCSDGVCSDGVRKIVAGAGWEWGRVVDEDEK